MPVAPCMRIRETLAAQPLQDGQPVAAGEPATRVDVERADADHAVGQLRRLQRWLGNSVGVQRLPDDGGVPLVGERQPGQPRHRLAVAQQGQQDRRRRQTRRVVERAVDRVEHPHQRRVDVGAAELLAVHLDAGRSPPTPRPPGVRWPGPPRWRSRCPSSARRSRRGGRTMNGLAASSRIAAASATRASRSVSSSAIAGYSPYRGERLRQRESPGVQAPCRRSRPRRHCR